MNRYIQLIFCLLCFIDSSVEAQSNRINKTYNVQMADSSIVRQDSNVNESIEMLVSGSLQAKQKSNSEVQSTSSTKMVPSGTYTSEPKKNASVNNSTETQKKVAVVDNSVTFVKTDDSKELQNNTVSETVHVKPVKSENFKPHTVREDIQNVQIQQQSSSSISEMKKAYLKEEAADLEKEIELFKNDPNYNLAEKQKQLADIKKLIQ